MIKGKRHTLSVIALHVVIISGAFLTVLPLVWMVYSSFKSTAEIFRYPPWLPPDAWSFANYDRLFTDWDYLLWYRNSIFYALSVIFLIMFFTSLAGYAFAKYRFRGKNVLFIILIGSTMIPFQLIMIPLYIMMSRIHWVNSWESMVIPWVAPAFGIFLMRQYIISIPDELLESARIDGASEFRIYWQIVVPITIPALVTQGILSFLSSWNSYIWPLMVLRGSSSTLPVGLGGMLGSSTASEAPYGPLMAGATLISIPVIVLFVMLQRYIMSGLTIGAVKS